LDTVGFSHQPPDLASRGMSSCLYCCEGIHSAASFCTRCRSNVVPMLQRIKSTAETVKPRHVAAAPIAAGSAAVWAACHHSLF
jgi:hypothetical protein